MPSIKSHLEQAESFYNSKGWKSYPFQKDCLKACLAQKEGLLNVPTGFGKTNALLMPIILDGLNKGYKKGEIQAIWITPLRALSKEILDSAEELSEFFDLKWRVALRNGDTSVAQRQKLTKSPPQVLITTPESLHLMLAQKGYENRFRNLQYFVIDEWHEMIGSKRGVQIELALSRLRTISPLLKTWGISATIGNLDEAAQVLMGQRPAAFEPTLITSKLKKKIVIESIIPDEIEHYPWSGHLGVKLAHKVVPIVEASESTILFTNTRSQAEMWYQNLLEVAPQLAGAMALHHGSLNRELRDWVENALHEGVLKLVVATASLDLGVDFRPVDTVIQVGGPKGVARFVQRAGRSGHRPGETSRIYFLPTHALELIEAAALREAVKAGTIESRTPFVRSFDVLVQYLVTLAVSEGFKPEAILKEIRQTHCYESLSDEEWMEVLEFIRSGGSALEAYTEFQRVEINEDGLWVIANRKLAMRHRLSIGTIVSDSMLNVKFMKGGSLGHVEESFVTKLNPGDTFWFAGRMLEMVKIKEMTVYVKKSKAKEGKVPAWGGGRMPLSNMLGEGLRNQLTSMAEDPNTKLREIRSLIPLFDRQKELSLCPSKDQLLLEYFQSKEGYHLMVYPFEGRFVHEAIASILAYRTSLLEPISFSIAVSDYGFELLSNKEIPIQEIIDNDFFTTDRLMNDLQAGINSTEMARRQFRDIAGIAGLVFQGYPGKNKKERHLQASSKLFFEVFRDYEPNNLLLKQAYEDALQHHLEVDRVYLAMERIGKLEVVVTTPKQPTPLSFPIMVDRMREKMSSEKLVDRIKKMQLKFTK